MNATESEQKFEVNVFGMKVANPSTLWQMTANNLDAANRVGQVAQVEPKEIPIGEVPRSLTVAPISINLYRFPVAKSAQ